MMVETTALSLLIHSNYSLIIIYTIDNVNDNVQSKVIHSLSTMFDEI